jgi:hypothetical protein
LYGYGHLVTPIMNAGGRLAMYALLGMEQPPITSKPKVKKAPKLVIDRTGEADRARYSGLKLGQVLDDNLQAAALEAVDRKVKSGEPIRQKMQEEMYELPFAERRNVSPAQTPDWTPERLDEWGKQQGKAQAWARRAKEGEFVGDPYETLDMALEQRVYSLLTGLCVALAYGKSTPTALAIIGAEGDISFVLDTLRLPSAALLLAAIGSSAFCALQAPGKNRSSFVWFAKGLLGGPLAALQLGGLPELITFGQQRENSKK